MESNYSNSLGVILYRKESTLVHLWVVHCSQYRGIIDLASSQANFFDQENRSPNQGRTSNRGLLALFL